MKNLLYNIRFYILTGGMLLSLLIYLWIITIASLGLSQIALLVEVYGLLSVVFLYFTLLAGPFCYTFSSFSYSKQYLKARRALGVTSCYFAFLHTGISFFGQLDGFSGLVFLDTNYLIAVGLGFIALFIFSVLTITSVDYAVEKLSFPKWKLLHRFVYLAGMLILIHAVMLGVHFSTLSENIPQVTFFALVFLLLLEAPRFDNYLNKMMPIPRFGITFVLMAVVLTIIYFSVINPFSSSSNSSISFDIHSAHKLLAQQALQEQSQQIVGIDINKIPGLNGDRTKRYTVSISTDNQNPQPNQDVTIHFNVYDASSGFPVSYFRILYAKQMHLIVVNSDLTYFNHIHPTKGDNGEFSITTQFPQSDKYHLYLEFQPFGGIEQQVGFTLPVGQISERLTFSKAQPDTNKAKKFDDYTVSVDTHGALQATTMTLGAQMISFTLRDAKTGKPITTLKPYLASFGHLTMINEKTFDFIHVHPYSLTVPSPNANGGPTVDFLPIGIYGPFKPGIYRAFAEFNPDNKLITTDFAIKIN